MCRQQNMSSKVLGRYDIIYYKNGTCQFFAKQDRLTGPIFID